MKTQYDAIVVGAGHNGLICAAYLARSRKKVLVLERRPLVGGSCVTEEVWPGYHVSTTSYVMSMMQRKVVEELELNKYGWKVLPTECLFVPFPDGTHFSLWEDQKRTLAEVAKLSKKDAETYPEFEKFLTEAGAFVRQLFWSTPPNPTSNRLRDLKDLLGIGRKFRKLGGKLYRFTDLLTMSISDFLDMYFESDKLKAVKAYYGSIGTFLGPRSPGTAYVGR
jgi:phytoene dehydrogenase-like protein